MRGRAFWTPNEQLRSIFTLCKRSIFTLCERSIFTLCTSSRYQRPEERNEQPPDQNKRLRIIWMRLKRKKKKKRGLFSSLDLPLFVEFLLASVICLALIISAGVFFDSFNIWKGTAVFYAIKLNRERTFVLTFVHLAFGLITFHLWNQLKGEATPKSPPDMATPIDSSFCGAKRSAEAI